MIYRSLEDLLVLEIIIRFLSIDLNPLPHFCSSHRLKIDDSLCLDKIFIQILWNLYLSEYPAALLRRINYRYNFQSKIEMGDGTLTPVCW